MKLKDFDFRVWDNGKYHYPIKNNNDILDINLSIGINDEIELWTGLYDKNDKKIFEGDIITAYNFGHKYIYIVKFCKNGFMLTCNISEDAEQGREITYYEKYYDNFEIIGNIHENEELLK